MSVTVTIPHVGESVQEAVLVEWFVQDGAMVAKDEPLCVIETDKVTLEIAAEVDGVLTIQVPAGTTVAVGAVLATIEPSKSEGLAPSGATRAATEKSPAPEKAPKPVTEQREFTSPESAPAPAPTAPPAIPPTIGAALLVSPAVRRLIAEKQLDSTLIQATGPGGRLTKGDVLLYLEQAPAGRIEVSALPSERPDEVRKPMTPMRKRIAARLVEAKQQTAMVTTFNDIDMSRVMAERAQFKEQFQEKHHVGLGFMSFFVKACVAALQEIPEINAFVAGNDIVYHNTQHIGVAIGSGRGLVVPVIRHAEKLSFAEIEQVILSYVEKIKANHLELADLEGGTFTISNGGVYGSLLSTPLLNLPQSGILGMHRIENRPMVVDNQIVIRPMMYVALSYDHRLIDGREGVTFLKRVKELVENPERLLLEV
jgi:2-oxoglutarate dehydrogenase E2 component (dihydrolipoamide succinyltransferase)